MIRIDIPDGAIEVDGDFRRLVQVFTNLVCNAAKYTPPGGHIAVSVILGQGRVAVRVQDDGLGIEPDMLPRIFDIFVQSRDARGRAQDGLGIGREPRAAPRRAARRDDQRPERGSGSRQRVRRGASAPRPADMTMIGSTGGLVATAATVLVPTAGTVLVPDDAACKHRVLVVDDCEDVVDAACMLFTWLGHDCSRATSGTCALDEVESFHPDVVLLDIRLPDLSGYEVASVLRRRHGRELYLVALTGWGQPEDRARAFAAGFDQYILKPATACVLRNMLIAAERHREQLGMSSPAAP